MCASIGCKTTWGKPMIALISGHVFESSIEFDPQGMPEAVNKAVRIIGAMLWSGLLWFGPMSGSLMLLGVSLQDWPNTWCNKAYGKLAFLDPRDPIAWNSMSWDAMDWDSIAWGSIAWDSSAVVFPLHILFMLEIQLPVIPLLDKQKDLGSHRETQRDTTTHRDAERHNDTQRDRYRQRDT